MARTCIICGLAAGSAEHVFPAALGGRRKNKAIYCDQHNNAYSGLVSHLSMQLEAFNALVGVRPDRRNEPKSATGIDQATGLPISYSIGIATFNEPRLVAEVDNNNGTKTRHMRFPNRAAVEKYVAERQAAGETVILGPELPAQLLHGDIRFDTNFGGPDGLRAIAYILQTYFAQYFGDLARTNVVAALKQYTLGEDGDSFVWWDFDIPKDYPSNRYEFGHRIVVGVDPSTGKIFGRMSLFSTLNFAAELGFVEAVADRPLRAFVVDIDPLAEHPPNDIFEQQLHAQMLVPAKPHDRIDGLRDTIHSGEAAASLGLLIGRMQDHVARRTAINLVERLTKCAADGRPLDGLFAELSGELSQRAFNLLLHVVDAFASQPGAAPFADAIRKLVETDPKSVNGLSPQASAALSIAQTALITKLKEEFQRGSLTAERAHELIASGPGAHVVGEAVLMPLVQRL
ncbi:HNH endonuclease [Caballeronia sordidicola]|uniref:HNH endonuclease n=1 Tax=Caballeronia sordidicola TaxID=196367 RepID=A0A226X672_CABSO|nr:HNH endonuclease [Caballeronia sordidicola]OXC78649.1 hypothetical protein BSU04_10995 [Caballeronia sordidicola]